MSEPVTNGTTPPQPFPAAPDPHLTQVVEHLALPELLLERGTTGLRRAGGYIREALIPELQGLQAVRTYKAMRDQSPVIGACLFAIEMLMRNVQWMVKPADTSDEAQRYGDLLSGMLFDDLDQPWSLVLSEILSFLPFGFSWFEMIFKRRQGEDPPEHPDGTRALPSRFADGLIGLGKLAPRAQDTVLRWEFDPTGSLRGMHQLDPWVGRHAYLPYEKCLLFRPTLWKSNPEGRSVLQTAYRAHYMVTNIENTEAIGIERDLTGIPLIYGPPQWWQPGADPSEVAQVEMLKRLGRSVRNDEQACIVLPTILDAAGKQLLTFQLVSSAGTKAIDTDTIIQRYELRMTQSLLCDMLFLGHEDVGSFALASSKTTTQAMSLGGYNTVIKDELNRRCVPLLWRLNHLPERYRPTLEHGDVESVDLTELARFMLSFGRIYNMDDLENHMRRLADLPERPGAETHPLPASIQPHTGASSHGGGSGSDIEELGVTPPGSGGGLPDLDRALSSTSLGF